MCLAYPAEIIAKEGDEGRVRMGSTRMRVSFALTPSARPGDFVLVHAGFALTVLTEEEAHETWELLRQMQAGTEVEE